MEIEHIGASMKERMLVFLNFGILAYFIGTYFLNIYGIHHIIINVFRSLLTTPFLIIQPLLIGSEISLLYRKRMKGRLLVISLGLLIINQLFMLICFFS